MPTANTQLDPDDPPELTARELGEIDGRWYIGGKEVSEEEGKAAMREALTSNEALIEELENALRAESRPNHGISYAHQCAEEDRRRKRTREARAALLTRMRADEPAASPAHDPAICEANERLATIMVGAAGKHAERVVELEAEVSTLRESLAEVNRLLSLNVAEVERMRASPPPADAQFICPHGKDVRHIECGQCNAQPPKARHCEMEEEGEAHDLAPGVVCIACWNGVCNRVCAAELRAAPPPTADPIAGYDVFRHYVETNIPPGTVISNPNWWAQRLWRTAIRASNEARAALTKEAAKECWLHGSDRDEECVDCAACDKPDEHCARPYGICKSAVEKPACNCEAEGAPPGAHGRYCPNVVLRPPPCSTCNVEPCVCHKRHAGETPASEWPSEPFQFDGGHITEHDDERLRREAAQRRADEKTERLCGQCGKNFPPECRSPSCPAHETNANQQCPRCGQHDRRWCTCNL